MRPVNKPTMHIVAGSNGSGKTTFATQFLPKFAKCNEFVNADLIAKGLSPFNPDTAAFSAGRIVLERIRDFIRKKISLGFETTLSGKTYLKILSDAKKNGYQIHIYFLWLPSANLAISRIADRVKEGGHDIPSVAVRRRYVSGVQNFFKEYSVLADAWILFDNSLKAPKIIAKMENGSEHISDGPKFRALKKILGKV